jgi:antitoxin component of MazEF toxin-antitoxin module
MTLELGARKVGRKGRALVVTLPVIWIRNNDVKPGNKMILTMEGRKLVLEPGKKGAGE